MAPVTTRTIRTLDIPLGAGLATLRASLTLDEHGAPESLIMAAGFGGADSGEPFLRPAWGESPLTIPASAVPALRDALARLEGAG